jgi:ribosomal protein S18 acetylase RimI-like enzyme
VIRRATVEDAEGIAAVHVRTWQAAYRHVFPPDALDAMHVEERIERWRQNVVDPGVQVFVADEDGVVGFVTVGPSRDPDCDGELWGIYVAPAAWGRGPDGELMRAGLESLGATFREAILWVLDDNPRARRFYEKHGWTLDGATKRRRHLGVDTDEVRYRIVLAPFSERGTSRV